MGGKKRRRLDRGRFVLALAGLSVAAAAIAILAAGAGPVWQAVGYAFGFADGLPGLPAFWPALDGARGWAVLAAFVAWLAAFLAAMAMRFRDMGLPGWGPALFSGFLVGAGGSVIAPWEVVALQLIILAVLCAVPSGVFEWGAVD